jgi:predicted small secreted protein
MVTLNVLTFLQYDVRIIWQKKGDMMKFRLMIAVFLMSVLVSACGTTTPAGEQNAAQPDTAVDADTTQNEESDAEPTLVPSTEESSPSDSSTQDLAVWTPDSYSNNLQSLKSYTLTFTYSVTTDGTADTWSWKQSAQSDPAITVSTWKSSQNNQEETTLVTSADKTYMVSGSPKTCMIMANDEENKNVFNPELILDSFGYDLVAAGAGPDINGRATDKYTYDSTLPDGSSYQSTVYVDRAEGFTMQWDVSGKNKNGESLEPFAWTYALSDINAVPTLSIPTDCDTLSAARWPQPADAVVTMQTPEMYMLTSAGTIADTASFYADAMEKAGYTPADGGMDSAEMVMQMYTKDGKDISVMISASEGKTLVVISQS